jgi:uncharacterized protein (DUF849 family)
MAAINGAHVRVGLEDSVYSGKGKLAVDAAISALSWSKIRDHQLGDAVEMSLHSALSCRSVA